MLPARFNVGARPLLSSAARNFALDIFALYFCTRSFYSLAVLVWACQAPQM